MKNFSLKALGAFLFAAGLVVAGVAAPASATPTVSVTSGTTLPTFQASVVPGAFSITVDNGGAFSGGMTEIIIASNMSSWFINDNCATSGTPYASSGCGISSITAATGATGTLGSPMAFRIPGTPQGIRITGLGDVSAFNISFSNTAWNAPGLSGTYYVKIDGVNSALALNVAAAPPPTRYTLSFNSNGGTGTMSEQTLNSGSNPLPANSFTKSGTTFSGWATSCGGSVVYANRGVLILSANTTLWAVWADGSNSCGGGGAGGSASANLTLNATTGQLIAGSTVGVSASGLQSTAAYTVTVQSTPQTIGSGNAVSGAVSTTVTLPSGLEAGWHTLTFTSTASDGSAVESKYYFKISATGTLLSTSSTIPAELANTGINSATGISLLAGGLSLALVGAEMFMIARRKRSN